MKKHLLAFLALFGLAASANIAKAESVDIVFSCSQSTGNVISASNAVTKTYMLAANSQDLVSSLSNASYLAGGASKSVRVGTYSSSAYTKGSLTLNLATGYKIKSIDVKLATYKSSNNKAPKNPTWNLDINGNQMAADLSSEVKTATTYSIPFSDSSTEVKSLTIKNTNAPVEVYSLTINYAEDGPITVSTPTFSNVKGQVTLGCSTTGATIMYHVGDAAVTDAAACTTTYTEPFTVKKGQFVSAYAKKDGATASEVISKQITWESLPVGDVVSTPAADGDVITVERGSIITFSATNADALAFIDNDKETEIVSNPYNFTVKEETLVMVTPIQDGEEVKGKDAMFTIKIKAEEPSENEEWTLVTDANQLSANATYIIAATNGSSSYGLATIAKSTRMDYVETTVTDDVIIDPESDLMRLKLEIDNSGTTPKYYWKTLNYAGGEQGYVSGSGPNDKNKYNTDLKVLEANTYALTTVAVSNKNATITFTNNNSRVLAINLTNNNYSFGCYASSNLGTSSYTYPRIYTNAGATRPVWRTTANGDIEILSTKGELHIMVFDEDGNQINNDGSKARALAADATWTNKVKEAGEIHTISKPAAGEGKILIQAKEVYNGIHSKEVKFSLASDGTTTGITAVEAEDADAPVEYYNMQGVRVMNPGQGLYIRRQGNRVEKVALR